MNISLRIKLFLIIRSFDFVVEQEDTLPANARTALLLNLNKDIYLIEGSTIVDIVKKAKIKGIDIILVYEQDIEKGGCPFSRLLIIEKTSTELHGPPFRTFREIAIPLYTRDEYHEICLRLILQKMGATNVKEPKFAMAREQINFRSIRGKRSMTKAIRQSFGEKIENIIDK